MTWTVFRALWGHWRCNLLQLFTLIAGLALATALWSGVQGINTEARASYNAAAATLGDGTFAQLVAPQGKKIDVADYIALRRAGWLVSPVVEGRLNGVRLIGMDPLTAPEGLASLDVIDAQSVFDPDAIWVAPDAVEKMAGHTVQVSADIAPNSAIMDISQAIALLGQSGLSRLIILPQQPVGIPPLSEVVPELLLREVQNGNDITRLTDSFHLNLTAFGFLSFAVGIFIVHGAVGLAFEQRRPMIRTLRALGVPLSLLFRIIAIEMLLLAIFSGALGIILGYIVASALLPDVAATLRGLYGADVSGSLSLRPQWWLAGLGIAVFGAFVASLGTFIRLAKMQPLDSGKVRAWSIQATKYQNIFAVLGGFLLVVTIVLGQLANNLIFGFALLGSLLIGAALILPWLLSCLLKIVSLRSKGPISQWFWADSHQQLPSLSLALMALLLAMAVNIGVSTMVSSFRITFVGFLDQRLSSELYFNASSPEQAQAFEFFSEGRVKALLPIERIKEKVSAVPTEIYGPVDHETYELNWRFISALPDPWKKVHSGQAVVVNEQLAYRANLSLGDKLLVAGHTLPLAGIYGDYGNPIGQAIIGRELFQKSYPEMTALNYGIRIDPAQVDGFIAKATSTIGTDPSQFVDQSNVKAFSLSVFERTFSVTNALNLLTLFVAGFAILMSLLTLSALRLPQLAPIWALGETRRRLALYELGRAVFLAMLTVLLAVPFGLVLAWVLLEIINVAAFGWRLPMFITATDYLALGAQALIAAVLAATWPAWRLSRIPPAELLKVFSNER